jgi:hypothetical protein
MELKLKSEPKKDKFADLLSEIDQAVYESLRSKNESARNLIDNTIRQFERAKPLASYQ